MGHIYFNADFVPMTGKTDTFEALVTDNKKIVFTGSLDEAKSKYGGFKLIDLEGRCVLPGLIDPHSHFSGASQYSIAADLSAAISFDDVVETMIEFESNNSACCEKLVMGVLYDQNNLEEQTHPNRHVLDKVSSTKPVVIIHASNHMLVANTKMLELAGITCDTPDPEGGKYGREDGGVPDGYCEEMSSMGPVFAEIGKLQHIDFNEIIDDMQQVYLSQGITTVQDGATSRKYMDVFKDLSLNNKLVVDLVTYPMYGEEPEKIVEAYKDLDSVEYTNHLRIGGYKMFLDGSPQGLTAWTSKPYVTPHLRNKHYCAYPSCTDTEVYSFCKMAIDSGHQLLAHTNGDQASEQFLVQYAKAYNDSENKDKELLRPVMIHCQLTRKDQYERMGAINMIPSIFVSHCWYWGDVHIKNFGTQRAGRISAVRDAQDCGLPYTFHCDTPVLRPKLLEAVWCSVARLTKNGVSLNEDQAVSVFDGLKAITVNASYQYGEENSKGTLEVGKLADMCVLDTNPLKCEVDDIRNIRVLKTIKEDEVVFEA